MALPLAVAATAAVHRRKRLPAALIALLVGLGLTLVVLMGVFGAISGLRPQQGGYGPSASARAEIPVIYLRLYSDAGQRYGVDPWVLAGIGWVETQHGRSRAPGVRSGVNAFGCCAGPMQFSLVGSPSTWDSYGVDGNRDGQRSPYDPADAIPAAARYLRASGAPHDYRAALFAYNHADWYVAQVLAKADSYRGARTGAGAGTGIDPATSREVLTNERITLTPIQRTDLRAGGIDPRLLSTLAWIGRRHSVVVTALQTDHKPGTNHEAGRAMDIGLVDGETCRGGRRGACADLVRELAAVEGELRSTELIYCWDPDGPADPRGFARADHCDHIHWGMDG
jgi:soluble lytic murein transglycosylase-like protein